MVIEQIHPNMWCADAYQTKSNFPCPNSKTDSITWGWSLAPYLNKIRVNQYCFTGKPRINNHSRQTKLIHNHSLIKSEDQYLYKQWWEFWLHWIFFLWYEIILEARITIQILIDDTAYYLTVQTKITSDQENTLNAIVIWN